MTTKELLAYHEQLCLKGREIMAKKNHDYSGASGETPFANFMVAEHLNITGAEKGILLRITDKLMRIITYLNAGELKVNESVEDAIVDNINYFILLGGLIKDRQPKPKCDRIGGCLKENLNDPIASCKCDHPEDDVPY